MKNLITAIVVALGLTTSAQAATFVYDLFDHPNVQKPNFEYGLRQDEAGPRYFSFENGGSAVLIYDDVIKKARIMGTMVESLGGGSFGDTFEVFYALDNVSDLGGGFFKDFFGGGNGTITNTTNAADVITLGAQANKNGKYFELDADGQGIPGDNSTIVGRGWTNFLDANSTNDFKFTAELNPGAGGSIPLPAAAWMLLSGVAGLGVMARRRRNS